MSLAELNWDWPEIACVLMWKLAPTGTVLTRKDLGALPMDRVLIEDRQPDRISLSFTTLKKAMDLREALHKLNQPAGVSALEGRWKKLSCVLLWKLCKGGVVLTQHDRDALPTDKTLLTHGHKNDVLLRFLPRAEAARIQKWEKEHEGKDIMETLQ